MITYKLNLILYLLLPFLFASCVQDKIHNVDLTGQWAVMLDPANEGIEQEWYRDDFKEFILLPGCLQEQGFGEKPGPDTKWWAPLDLSQRHPSLAKYGRADENFKLIQFLVPERHYIGAAWYSREIEIPKSFEGKRITLSLERCHWESRVWVDGTPLGSSESLATPHVYDLSQFASGLHKLSIRIDNGKIQELGSMPHSVSDETQGTWNGIVGEIAIKVSDPVYIKLVNAHPDISEKSVRISAEIANVTGTNGSFKIIADALGYNAGNTHNPALLSHEGELNGSMVQRVTFTYPLGEQMQLWDEFDPRLYRVKLTLSGETEQASYRDEHEICIGMREISTDGKYFFMNGIKTFMRGNVDCAVNPATGYAPMSVERWKEIFRVHKNFGLNYVRFHSWCPPKQAFIAADEIGIYLAPEVHEWTSVKAGPVQEYLKKESAKMLSYLGNHPSFVMMGLGNENVIEESVAEDFISQWKQSDRRHLYTIKASVAANAGKPDEMDFEVLGHVKDDRFEGGRIRTRYQAFWPPVPEGSLLCTMEPQTVLDWREGVEFYHSHFKRPLFSHETAQFCAYPDIYNEMEKYTGYLQPTYLEIAAEQLEERGMSGQLADFVEQSGKWQVLLTREEIEASFRTAGLAGFQWLALNDFTGQNTAPVGFTDAFYESKSYVDGDEMKRFCGPTVLLARLPRRVFTSDETFSADFELSHFDKEELILDDFEISIKSVEDSLILSKQIPAGSFKQGNAQFIASVELKLDGLPAPAKYKLEISSPSNSLVNDWDFWVYPKDPVAEYPGDMLIATAWETNTQAALEAGKTVLLLPEIGTLKGNLPPCFTTFYWTSFDEKGGQSSACGITLDEEHPLFSDFPTESHANWQWWDMLTQCQPMILDQFEEANPWPLEYRPLVQPIDTWKLNRKLGLLVEAKVAEGELLICSIDLINNLESRPAARQFRKSLIAYIQSPYFNPQTQVESQVITSLFDN